MAYVHLQVLVKKKDDSINTSAIINKLGVSNEAPLFMQVSPHCLSKDNQCITNTRPCNIQRIF